jgi:hypothetical protein
MINVIQLKYGKTRKSKQSIPQISKKLQLSLSGESFLLWLNRNYQVTAVL